jgi:spore coat polysaccharide biosynthesis protein SpsF
VGRPDVLDPAQGLSSVKVVAVVQARMASSRLPGKVLMDLHGTPLVAHTLRRLSAARRVDDIVLATTDGAADDPLVALAQAYGVAHHRGSETDVLRRIRDAAAARGADVVVRVTGDCPLLDAAVVDRVVEALLAGRSHCDYASNVIARSYPKGLDAEALWMDVLDRIDRLATSASAREHVTWFAYGERPELFLLSSVEIDENFAELNWSVDTHEDLERVRELMTRAGTDAPWRDVLAAVAR